MRSNVTVIAIASALIGSGTTASLMASAQHDQHHGHSTAGMEQGAKMLHEEMMKSAKKTLEGKMPMANDTDKAFGLMMADHHMGAIRMADIELKHGNDPGMKAMARKIKAAQIKEAPQLRSLAAKAK